MTSSSSIARREEEEIDASDVLPSELWAEILVRFPVWFLLTLKLVSKSFLSLIKNPNFTSLHFCRFQNCYSQSNTIGCNLLLLERHRIHRALPYPNGNLDFSLLHRSFTPPSETIEFTTHIYGPCDSEVLLLGCVNGLLFVVPLGEQRNHMFVYNPLIGKRLMIPKSPSSSLVGYDLAFGYDPVTDDYKVVSIVYTRASPWAAVEIYNLGTASWRTLGFDVLPRGWFFDGCVYLNGCLHWIARWNQSSTREGTLTHIALFDLGTELFSFRELPKFDHDGSPGSEMRLLVVVFEGSLAVVCVFKHRISFWVMRESSWTKECCVEATPDMLGFLLRRNHDNHCLIFSEGSNELIATGQSGMFSYNIETKEFKFCHSDVTHVVKYAESLIWGEWVSPINPTELNKKNTNGYLDSLEIGKFGVDFQLSKTGVDQ